MDPDAPAGLVGPARPQAAEGGADAVQDVANGVLTLSPSVTLSLGQDALLISSRLSTKRSRSCLCVPAPASAPKRSIPYYNILWAEVTDDRRWLTVDYADQESPSHLVVRNAKFAIPELDVEQSPAGAGSQIAPWVERLLDRSYGSAARCKRAWVLVNPRAGPGGADKLWETQARPIFEAARMPMTVVRTSYSGQAVELARDLNIDDYDIAVPCSGDGLPHEVFNGLAQRPDARHALAKIAVCHVPCGSGNAMSCNLYGTHRPGPAALAIVKGVPTPLDLVSVTHGDRRTISFLSQALGTIAECDLGTEHLRWMGASRFTYGFLRLVMQKKTYPCDIAVKVEIEDKDDVKEHYRRQVAVALTTTTGSVESCSDGSSRDQSRDRVGQQQQQPGCGEEQQSHGASPASSSVDGDSGPGLPPLKYGTVLDKLPDGWETVQYDKLGNFYCGNMAYMAPDANFFAAALANDGLLDLITTDGDISPLKSVGLQLAVDSGRFFDSPLVRYRKVSAYRVTPRASSSSNQEGKGGGGGYISIDGEAIPFGPFQAEVHRGLGLTLSKRGVFEAPGPRNWDTTTTVTASERLLA